MAEALRARGVDDTKAAMAAELGVLAFKVGFDEWTAEGNEVSLGELASAALNRFQSAMSDLH